MNMNLSRIQLIRIMPCFNILAGFLSCLLGFACSEVSSPLVVDLSPVRLASSDSLNGWETEYWSPQENYKVKFDETSSKGVLIIEADTFGISRWYRKVQLSPYSTYKVTGAYQLMGVEGQDEKAGAGIRLGHMKMKLDTVLRGDSDWISFEEVFDTEGYDSFLMELVLGKSGPAKGKVFLKDVIVEELGRDVLKPSISIDVQAQQTPMEPYIYGQFIEHMGKCIYGGIWAELLVDRKFYYAPGVKKSAWEVVGNQVIHDDSYQYSGNPTPKINAKLYQEQGIQQAGIGFLAKKYSGYFLLNVQGEVDIDVYWFDESSARHMVEITEENVTGGLIKVCFSFEPNKVIDQGGVGIVALGAGGVHVLASSLMPDDHVEGFRADVLALMKTLDSPIYRWPGGNFVSGYDWKDGVGDRDKRPTRYERAWDGLETNDVGIHEFMNLCRLLGTEANIAVNTGLGSAEMAAEQVQYVNGGSNTKLGKWRAENGRKAPYEVKLWAVGNEMFGDWQLGHMPIEQYVEKHNEVAKSMREVDPSIELIGVGFPGHWNDMMYAHSLEYMDYISEHIYKQDWHSGGLLTHARQLADVIREVATEHRKRSEDARTPLLRIAMDEWNYWYGPHVHGLLGTRYFLRDALGIASGLHEFSRQSDIYYMANYAQTVNVIGAIKATQTSSWMEATGHVLAMYRKHFGSIPLVIHGDHRPLDIAASLTEDKKTLSIAVVNATYKNYSLPVDLGSSKVHSQGEMILLSSKDDMDYNDEDNQKIDVQKLEVKWAKGNFDIPQMSVVIFKFDLME